MKSFVNFKLVCAFSVTPKVLKEIQDKQDKHMTGHMKRIIDKQRKKDNPSDEPTDRTKAMNITDEKCGDPDLTGMSGSSIAGDNYGDSNIGTGQGMTYY